STALLRFRYRPRPPPPYPLSLHDALPIAEHVDELVGLRDTVDRLSGISDTVDEMVSVTRRIPFWRAISGRPRANTRQRVPENKRRRADDGNKKDNDEE